MLSRVLMQFAQGEIQSTSILASRLGITELMLDDMLDALEVMGYIKTINPECGNCKCSSCYMPTGCNKSEPRQWVLSEKGIKQVAKDQGY